MRITDITELFCTSSPNSYLTNDKYGLIANFEETLVLNEQLTLENATMFLFPPKSQLDFATPLVEGSSLVLLFDLPPEYTAEELLQVPLSIDKTDQLFLTQLQDNLRKQRFIKRGKPDLLYDFEIGAYFNALIKSAESCLFSLLNRAQEKRWLIQLPPAYQEALHTTPSQSIQVFPKNRPVVDYEQLIQEIISYMQEHLSDNLSIEQIADTFYVSSSTLKKYFKKSTNKSMMSYYKELRLEKAKQLILTNEISYTEIANRLGFHSIHHFSSFFKKQVGLSPSEYARTMLENNNGS